MLRQKTGDSSWTFLGGNHRAEKLMAGSSNKLGGFGLMFLLLQGAYFSGIAAR